MENVSAGALVRQKSGRLPDRSPNHGAQRLRTRDDDRCHRRRSFVGGLQRRATDTGRQRIHRHRHQDPRGNRWGLGTLNRRRQNHQSAQEQTQVTRTLAGKSDAAGFSEHAHAQGTADAGGVAAKRRPKKLNSPPHFFFSGCLFASISFRSFNGGICECYTCFIG